MEESVRTVPPSPLNITEPAIGAGSPRGGGVTGAGTGQETVSDQILALLMQIDQNSRRFRPAQLHKGKTWVIKYYVLTRDTDTGKETWARKREKVNKPKNLRLRLQVARDRIRELNNQLAMGWAPWLRMAGNPSVPLVKACEEFLRSKEKENRRLDTMRTYNSNVRIMLRWLSDSPYRDCTVRGFSSDLAKAYMKWCYTQRDLSPKSYNNTHTFQVTLWNWFKAEGYCDNNVFLGLPKKEQNPDGSSKRPPTEEERTMIRKDLEQRRPRFLTFCLLCFHCGIRPKEAFMLKPEHFDVRNQVIVVERSIAKNKRTMGVAIPGVAMPHIMALGLEKQKRGDYVFSRNFDPGPQLLNSRDSGREWERMRKRIHLDQKVTMYQLKHAGGEQLSRDGLSDVDLMNHFRHHDLSETSRYTRRTYKEGVRSVINRATPM
jgi:integrase